LMNQFTEKAGADLMNQLTEKKLCRQIKNSS
jgi:hypothetical protein